MGGLQNLSNLNGRVLEYLITESVEKSFSFVKLTNRADESQKRDAAKLREINPVLMAKLTSATYTLLRTWLEPHFNISQRKSIIIGRLPDQNKYDVTDIRLASDKWTVNLSMKHNHTALKHQRPRTTPIHCGFTKGDIQLETFQNQYQTLTKKFIATYGNINLFSELKAGIIERELYTPICNHVADFINNFGRGFELFKYLVGDRNYHKVVVDTHKRIITISHFNSISPPQNVSAKVARQYVILNFNNGWEISMRLHTASSRIGRTPSLKFDTQAVNNPIPSTTIGF